MTNLLFAILGGLLIFLGGVVLGVLIFFLSLFINILIDMIRDS